MSGWPHTIIFLCITACTVGQLNAHPHLWITAKADLLFDADNQFIGIRHQWEFDEAFAAFATQGLDKNWDGRFSREELAGLARTNVESVADFDYFTFIQHGKVKIDYEAATNYWLEYEDRRLTLFYTLSLVEPLKLDSSAGSEKLTIEVYDPEFFAAVEFAAANPVTLRGSALTRANCSVKLALPQELAPAQTELLSRIGPAENVPDSLAPDIGYLANTVTVTCTS